MEAAGPAKPDHHPAAAAKEGAGCPRRSAPWSSWLSAAAAGLVAVGLGGAALLVWWALAFHPANARLSDGARGARPPRHARPGLALPPRLRPVRPPGRATARCWRVRVSLACCCLPVLLFSCVCARAIDVQFMPSYFGACLYIHVSSEHRP
uniref:Uncharacterized protein n=1 Tax=Zea mays TaxID=4577 RepID=B6U8I8_MAIZE|nr:hypothetical protein [Zea mays]|eukprot:NP_001145183.1 uncharacterized protein LOC100278429 [Zea mays]